MQPGSSDALLGAQVGSKESREENHSSSVAQPSAGLCPGGLAAGSRGDGFGAEEGEVLQILSCSFSQA